MTSQDRTDLRTADDVISDLVAEGWDHESVRVVLGTMMDAGLEVTGEDVVLLTDAEVAMLVEQLEAGASDDEQAAEDREESRYDAVQGSYTGTSDDVAGRWYAVDTTSNLIDKRGRGHATRAEALEAVAQRVDPSDLVGVAEIAERAGVKVTTVHTWRLRHATFPAPVVVLAAGPVWDWQAVVRAGFGTKRQTGRPARTA